MVRDRFLSATWAFDIETAHWDHFIVGCAVSNDGRKLTFNTPEECAAWYVNLPKNDLVLAHFGGGFDFLFLISITPRLTWSARMAGSTIVSCRANGHAECRDTSRMFPISLAKWTGQKGETGLACIGLPACRPNCPGFCAIVPGLSGPKLARLTSYCMQDCQALIDAWQRDIDRMESDGFSVYGPKGNIRLTFGSVAWNTAASMANIDPKEVISWPEHDAGRRAYYGGRTEVGCVKADVGHCYDVNSMYPWALTKPVPVGKHKNMIGMANASRAYRAGTCGLYEATVTVPRGSLPTLPHRAPTTGRGRLHPGRLLWATGTIRGWWALPELEAAESHGTEIVSIHAAVTYATSDTVYAPYVEHAYAIRRQAKETGDKRWDRVIKFLANALTGKLAQRPEIASVKVIAEGADLPGTDDDGGAWLWVGGRVWAKQSRRLSPNSRPCQAAYLTARSRVKLLARLKAHAHDWLYCDTDSTYIRSKDDTDVHQTKLGSWAYEGKITEWRALAPKLYRYRDRDGVGVVKARGVPRATWTQFDSLASGDTVTVENGVARLRTSGGTFTRRDVARTHLDTRNALPYAGTRTVLADGTTVPLHRDDDGTYHGATD